MRDFDLSLFLVSFLFFVSFPFSFHNTFAGLRIASLELVDSLLLQISQNGPQHSINDKRNIRM